MRHQRTNLIHIQPKPVFSIPIKINQVTYIPSDASLAEFDLKGENVFYLPSDAAIVQGVRQALREIGLIEA